MRKMEEERWRKGDERGEEGRGEGDGRCGNIDERQWLGKRRALNVKKMGDVGLQEEENCILEEGGKEQSEI